MFLSGSMPLGCPCKSYRTGLNAATLVNRARADSTKQASYCSTEHSGGKRRAVNVHSTTAFRRCYRLFSGGMAPLFCVKDGYLRIWMSFLYLLCALFGRFI